MATLLVRRHVISKLFKGNIAHFRIILFFLHFSFIIQVQHFFLFYLGKNVISLNLIFIAFFSQVTSSCNAATRRQTEIANWLRSVKYPLLYPATAAAAAAFVCSFCSPLLRCIVSHTHKIRNEVVVRCLHVFVVFFF